MKAFFAAISLAMVILVWSPAVGAQTVDGTAEVARLAPVIPPPAVVKFSAATSRLLSEADLLSEAFPYDFAMPFADRLGRVHFGLITDASKAAMAAVRVGNSGALALLGDLPTHVDRPEMLSMATNVAASAQIYNAARSRAELESVRDQAILSDSRVFMTSVDGERELVVAAIAEDDSELRAALEAQFPSMIGVTVDPLWTPLRPQGRQWDSNPLSGGARIRSSIGNCTSGFSWATLQRSFMITAAHCAPNGDWIETPSEIIGFIAPDTKENWDPGTGTVLFPGQNTYRGDIAQILIDTDDDVGPYIYTGGPNSLSRALITGMTSRASQLGDEFCTGGQVSGAICDWTVATTHANISYGVEGVVRNVTVSDWKTGYCTQLGDSGGPAYISQYTYAAVAKGIISGGGGGGDDHYGGLLDPCKVVITDLQHAENAFPGHLLVG